MSKSRLCPRGELGKLARYRKDSLINSMFPITKPSYPYIVSNDKPINSRIQIVEGNKNGKRS